MTEGSDEVGGLRPLAAGHGGPAALAGSAWLESDACVCMSWTWPARTGLGPAAAKLLAPDLSQAQRACSS
eukprot:NODE_5705_length_683_cov_4.656151_g4825_i0.p3 GENE.NODE_5705_length_683_cov_4.656151_g4825_i0~~NODE_5705_length_683_cov_4.656151_g4825_i0.p3  ORF type:complete len:70 (-),score=3.74 NODE_5705_length_683_cov_4.656151_g4825_i0:309-518(-)